MLLRPPAVTDGPEKDESEEKVEKAWEAMEK